ncbi:hypothetical protein EB001_22070 [bacterium]|nr:hypothetical protein [bacterium]
MASVRSKDLGIFLAKQFRESVSEPSSSNLYLTFGRSQSWINDANPPQANTSDASFYDVWNNMIGAKRITGNDIRHAIPRFDWSNNTVYRSYSELTDSKDLKSPTSSFYVLTDDFNVYKCISNNYGNVSTVKPTSTNPYSQFQTSDKYIWKYLYSISAEEQERFLTDSYMPVKTLLSNDNTLQWQVQDNTVDGAIHDIILVNRGTGYTSNNISVNVTGDGTSCNAFAVRNTVSFTIDSIVVDTRGSGYTFANVQIKSTRGAGATARAVISPPGGHGSDLLYELGGSYLMIDTKIKNSENGKLVSENNYRQISIIEDPYVYQSDVKISNTVVSQLTVLTLAQSSSTTNYQQDEIVFQGKNVANSSFKGVVVSWDSANSKLKLSNIVGIPSSDILTGNTSTTTRYVSSVLYPDMQRFTGKLLYIDQIVPIDRSNDQDEDFKIVLSF